MFVGGVKLLGLYQYGPDSPTALDNLCKHAAAVQSALICDRPATEVGDEWLLLQVAFGARKYTAKSFSGSGSAALKPAELKFQPLAGKLRFHSFTATLKVHLSTGSLPGTVEGVAVMDRLQAAAKAQCAVYEQEAVVSVDGKCVDGVTALPMLQAEPERDKKVSSAANNCIAHKVEIFVPNLGQPISAADVTRGNSSATGDLFGAVTVHAVLHEKGTTGAYC